MTPIRLVADLVLLALTADGRADPPVHNSEQGAAADERRDLPMLPRMAEHQKQNMRGHLEAVAAVVAALQQDDFAAIGRAASRMGSSEEMGRCARCSVRLRRGSRSRHWPSIGRQTGSRMRPRPGTDRGFSSNSARRCRRARPAAPAGSRKSSTRTPGTSCCTATRQPASRLPDPRPGRSAADVTDGFPSRPGIAAAATRFGTPGLAQGRQHG